MTERLPLRLKTLLQDPILFLGFGFGAGLSPIAPGTWGTVVAVPIFYGLSFLPLSIYLLLTVAILIVGIWICDSSAKRLGVHDYPGIVWDEIGGYLVAMIAVPRMWLWMIMGFLIFRAFDIAKPWPIGWADRRLKGGFGIMMDDILAGLYTVLLLHAFIYEGRFV